MPPRPTTTQSCQRLHVVMAATSWARPRIFGMRWARPPGPPVQTSARSRTASRSVLGVALSLARSSREPPAKVTSKYLRTQPDIPEIDLWSTSNVFLAGHRLRVVYRPSGSERRDLDKLAILANGIGILGSELIHELDQVAQCWRGVFATIGER